MSGRQQAAVLCVPRQANAVAWTSKLDVDTVRSLCRAVRRGAVPVIFASLRLSSVAATGAPRRDGPGCALADVL